ncbi:hypothetical protein FXN63_19735 [Pigmentiphaga aceris]|uniref:Uncharacterized protein n=1 Tax=Pigmentiphaga aceris TaxID=1940612 RepID=A0A5C0B5I5_9BURK|nr:hypothetical protein [Pigmentiphaga aceris]QEI07817.1 hypothetical protein FXN63_19735 [Pigmentiphaga aceris]
MRPLMLLVLVCSVGCTAVPTPPEAVVRTVEVKIPVPVPCIAAMPLRPTVDTLADILALRNADAALALMTQHNVLLAYVGELEAVLAGCLPAHVMS